MEKPVKLSTRDKLDLISSIQLGSLQECLLLGPNGISGYLMEVAESFKNNDKAGYQDLEKLLRCYIVYGAASSLRNVNFTGKIENLISDPKDQNKTLVKEILGETVNMISIKAQALIPPYSERMTETINAIYVGIQFLNNLKAEPVLSPYYMYIFGSFTSRVRRHQARYTVLYSIEEKFKDTVPWTKYLDDIASKPESLMAFYFIFVDALTQAAIIGVNNFGPFNPDDILIKLSSNVISSSIFGSQEIKIPFTPILTNFGHTKYIVPIKEEYISTKVEPNDLNFIRTQILSKNKDPIMISFMNKFPTDITLLDHEINALEKAGLFFG